MFAVVHSKDTILLEKPKIFTILESSLSIFHKKLVLYKLQTLEAMSPSDSEYFKLSQWIDNILEIPFNIYKQPNYINTHTHTHTNTNSINNIDSMDSMDTDTNTDIDIDINTDTNTDTNTDIEMTPMPVIFSNKIFTDARDHLDKVIYGQNDTKQHILEIIAKMISNPSSNGSVFAVEGAPGTGKTSLIKDGLSRVLGLPFIFISLGGAQDASYLAGENYAYVGSKCGKIIQALKSAKCLNPIFYFDELDKVSNTPQGREIINLLIHITDYSQNQHFLDYYMDGITVDLSHATFIFSFNDRCNVCPILLDRMDIIQFQPYSICEKQYIIEHYLIPSIATQYFNNKYKIGFRDNIQKNIILDNIINQTTNNISISWELGTEPGTLNVNHLGIGIGINLGLLQSSNPNPNPNPITILLYTNSNPNPIINNTSGNTTSNTSSNTSGNTSSNTVIPRQYYINKRNINTIKFKSKYRNQCSRCINNYSKHNTLIYKNKNINKNINKNRNRNINININRNNNRNNNKKQHTLFNKHNTLNTTNNTTSNNTTNTTSNNDITVAFGGVRYLKRQIEKLISKINIEILMTKT